MYRLTSCRTAIAGLAALMALTGLAPGSAWAQPQPQTMAPPSAAQPLARPTLPDLPYSSVFTHYQGYADQPVKPWVAPPVSAEQGHSHHHHAGMAPPAEAAGTTGGTGAAPPSQPIPQANHGNHGNHGSRP